ncbi:hypothetical protein T4B_10081 [Trichinella pseudospiralis]|uniref:Uncharacterized protein n=1 Tax=Trichinella pseudospiralis TaxID=6337 RepID=A0A0V1H8I0_TRIPS|nr:hypothetical protein T4B_10081 [Trichinella pseudospiralis]
MIKRKGEMHLIENQSLGIDGTKSLPVPDFDEHSNSETPAKSRKLTFGQSAKNILFKLSNQDRGLCVVYMTAILYFYAFCQTRGFSVSEESNSTYDKYKWYLYTDPSTTNHTSVRMDLCLIHEDLHPSKPADLQVISKNLLSTDEVPDAEIPLRTAVPKATGGVLGGHPPHNHHHGEPPEYRCW